MVKFREFFFLAKVTKEKAPTASTKSFFWWEKMAHCHHIMRGKNLKLVAIFRQ
jgi:hypothetical protein